MIDLCVLLLFFVGRALFVLAFVGLPTFLVVMYVFLRVLSFCSCMLFCVCIMRCSILLCVARICLTYSLQSRLRLCKPASHKQELPPLLDSLLCHRPTVEWAVHGRPTVEHLAVVHSCQAATIHVGPMNLTFWPLHALSQVWLTLISPLARLTLLRVSASGDDLLDSFEQISCASCTLTLAPTGPSRWRCEFSGRSCPCRTQIFDGRLRLL